MKGFAFVTLNSVQYCDAVIQNLDGKVLGFPPIWKMVYCGFIKPT